MSLKLHLGLPNCWNPSTRAIFCDLARHIGRYLDPRQPGLELALRLDADVAEGNFCPLCPKADPSSLYTPFSLIVSYYFKLYFNRLNFFLKFSFIYVLRVGERCPICLFLHSPDVCSDQGWASAWVTERDPMT